MRAAACLLAALVAAALLPGCFRCVTYPGHIDNQGHWVPGHRSCH